jgi:hypothetical protein
MIACATGTNSLAHHWRKTVCSTTACAAYIVGGGADALHHPISGGAGVAQQQRSDALARPSKVSPMIPLPTSLLPVMVMLMPMSVACSQ